MLLIQVQGRRCKLASSYPRQMRLFQSSQELTCGIIEGSVRVAKKNAIRIEAILNLVIVPAKGSISFMHGLKSSANLTRKFHWKHAS